jgi:hypothetical protein
MADGKKSFILYCDQRGIFNKLSDEQAGVLIKHIFAYVSDEDPKADFVTELAFESIKSQLKRDLKTWEVRQEQRREAGRKSAEARQQAMENAQRNPTTVETRSTESNERSVSSTVNGTVTVNGNGTVNEKKSKGGVTAPPPPLEDVIAYFTENGYTADAARKAWNYYNASLGDNGSVWKDGKGQTVKNWKQKMQAVWFKDENKIQQHTPRRLSF